MPENKKRTIQCEITAEKQKEVIYTAGLKDGTKAYCYFLDASCAWCLEQGLGLLSPVSRRYRFNFSFKKFTRQDLHYLTHIDNRNHVAIAARHPYGLDRGYPGMGVGRYIKLPKKPDTAEIALTIIDGYQNMGLGTVLFSLLAEHAGQNHITFFCGYVQAQNTAMLNLFQRFGARTVNRECGLLYLETDLRQCGEQITQVLQQYECPQT
jgi:GNAT superfamily N-acetyltransferase